MSVQMVRRMVHILLNRKPSLEHKDLLHLRLDGVESRFLNTEKVLAQVAVSSLEEKIGSFLNDNVSMHLMRIFLSDTYAYIKDAAQSGTPPTVLDDLNDRCKKVEADFINHRIAKEIRSLEKDLNKGKEMFIMFECIDHFIETAIELGMYPKETNQHIAVLDGMRPQQELICAEQKVRELEKSAPEKLTQQNIQYAKDAILEAKKIIISTNKIAQLAPQLSCELYPIMVLRYAFNHYEDLEKRCEYTDIPFNVDNFDQIHSLATEIVSAVSSDSEPEAVTNLLHRLSALDDLIRSFQAVEQARK